MATAQKSPASKAVFSAAEREAMKERVKEQKKGKGGPNRAEGEADLLAKLAQMSDEDRVLGQRIHEIISAKAPELLPSTWYGMPAWNKDGKTVCFFQPAAKFKARYAEFGFNDSARLDDGAIWPTKFALTKMTAATEKTIGELVKKAVG
jgi:uncharacterized protein YdhG (YjbR/CyaY superfamily)